ncbi:glycosyltransferase N-terminal domain-containing protein [Aliiroseovarius sediminis]|uniref:3-deoxy-D-manno-octulosonic acid transferase n=1 Tax=Aliiroseovarius sediminis TaxID=2925839 RepID=UPI001F5A6BED|nr:glycosyltransferase N-terminal domain-containing protein [Aliiroseovarius sediminis]MCI2394614.1 hypothetical protein [Aliiroseovarius sediminis]
MPPIGISLFRGLQNMQGAAGLERRLRRRLADGKEHPTRNGERLGRDLADRPPGQVAWIHMQNLDELEEVLGLVGYLKVDHEDLTILITTTDYDGPPSEHADFIHQYVPYSAPAPVAAFLDHWRPDALLWMDGRLDVTLLPAVFARKIPAFWVNAHVPKEAQRQWRWLPGSTKSILSGFDTVLAESDAARRELCRFGAVPNRVVASGPLQIQVRPPSCNMVERDEFAKNLAARPVWLAAGVCKVEEDALLIAHKQLVRKSHRLLLIIEPREMDRGVELAAELEAEGWVVACRSRDDVPGPDIQIFIADQEGESGLWMHLAPITYAGGSMGIGTELNPLEPAALGSVVLFGPKVNGAHEAYRRLERAGAATRIDNADDLSQAVEHLLSPDEAAKMAMAAWDVTTSGAEVSDLLRDKLSDALSGALG